MIALGAAVAFTTAMWTAERLHRRAFLRRTLGSQSEQVRRMPHVGRRAAD